MGWQLKAISLIAGFVAIPFGGWILTIPCFIYAFSGFIPWRRKRQQQVVVQVAPPPQQGENPPYAPAPHPIRYDQTGGSQRLRYPGKSVLRYVCGSVLLLLALAAAARGGTYSPLVIGGPGLLLVLWGPFSRAARISAVRPLHDSILLRCRFPLLWVAAAEVKLATQQPARPLSSLGERLVIFASEAPSVCVVLQRLAFSHVDAEGKMIERLRELAKAMAPLGAYLLPLDSSKVSDMLDLSLRDLKIDPQVWRQSLSAIHYDVLAVECEQGYVRSFAAYVKNGRKPPGKPLLPSAGKKVPRPPLLWELLHPVGARVRLAGPDAYTAFLSSMAVTENVSMGERVVDMGSDHDSQLLHVRSVGSPSVEVTRAELRSIVGTYTPPSKEGPIQVLLRKVRV